MAIQGVSGKQPTVYVIKGDAKAQNMAQFWSNLVSQQKYKLVQDAVKIAMAEEKSRATDRLAQQKLQAQQTQRLQRGIQQLEKQKSALITKEAQLTQQLEIAKTPTKTKTTGGGGSRGKKDPKAAQALAETKELRKLQAQRDELQRDKADFDRNAALFESSNPNFAAAERDKSAAAQTRINQIDNILNPGGNPADKDGNGMIDEDEIGSLLPLQSVSEGEKSDPRRTTTRKEIKIDPPDFSARRAELDEMITELERQGSQLVQREIEKDPTILARAAEISGRQFLGTQRADKMPVGNLAEKDIERRMMEKYFPQQQRELQSIAPKPLEIRKPTGKRPFSTTIENMQPEFTAEALSARNLRPQGTLPSEMKGAADKIPTPPMEASQFGFDPAESSFDIEDPNAPLNTSLSDPDLPLKRKTLKDRAEELRQRFVKDPITVPKEIGMGPDTSKQRRVEFSTYTGVPVLDDLGDMELDIPPEALLSGAEEKPRPRGNMSGIPILDDAVDFIRGLKPIDMDPNFDKPTNELELYNNILEGTPEPPPKEEGAFNTTGDENLKQAEALALAVEGGRTKTKQEVRRQLERAEDTEWASVVTKLYSPAPNATAQERIRLRDNAYQQLYKTYEDNPTVLADATEFLISLDALEMGALPSE